MDTINADSIIEFALSDANAKLGKQLQADVLLIKAPMQQPVDDRVRVEVEGIKERPGKPKDKLVVLVETHGGFVETVERIVSVFRRHYATVEYFVPNFAYSAGTLLVLSGDEIYMDYYSVLGPIDPQYPSEDGSYVPGMGYLAKFQELVERVNDPPGGDDSKVRAELAFLIKKFDPAKLFDIEQSIDHAKSLLKDWLPKYKFKDWTETNDRKAPVGEEDKKKRAEEIADVLGNTKRWHSHGRGITIRELASEEIKLKIANFGEEPKLNEAIRHYHGLFVDYLAKKGMRAALHSVRGVRRIV
ncbi:SDH family Clp fold serine proteinase [Terrarubrum flagellatum]|uniref:SDH family Clp fold serine proteinase n=1 Tax=Terrirubrum flagellatum TaxID=2895980 RepID=UPI0031453F9A